MNKNFKPQNYNSVSPYFIVENAQRWADLLVNIFDATELSAYKKEDGSIMHLELQIDDSVIMLSQATSEYPANQFMIHVYVPDASATYTKAIEYGCEEIQKPEQKNDPDLRGMFRDFAGHTWAVGTLTGK